MVYNPSVIFFRLTSWIKGHAHMASKEYNIAVTTFRAMEPKVSRLYSSFLSCLTKVLISCMVYILTDIQLHSRTPDREVICNSV